MILVYMLYLIALIVLEMIYRHEHVKVRFKSMHFFSLPSSYVLVETSGLTDGCVLITQRGVRTDATSKHNHEWNQMFLLKYNGEWNQILLLQPNREWEQMLLQKLLTPFQLCLSRNIWSHWWLCFDVASVLTSSWVYAAAPGFIPCCAY
jgi:hypothetical protein